jgi:hypothetical protein
MCLIIIFLIEIARGLQNLPRPNSSEFCTSWGNGWDTLSIGCWWRWVYHIRRLEKRHTGLSKANNHEMDVWWTLDPCSTPKLGLQSSIPVIISNARFLQGFTGFMDPVPGFGQDSVEENAHGSYPDPTQGIGCLSLPITQKILSYYSHLLHHQYSSMRSSLH